VLPAWHVLDLVYHEDAAFPEQLDQQAVQVVGIVSRKV